MAVVLLPRHAGTERPRTSLARLFGGIERLLAVEHHVLRLPTAVAWSDAALRVWLRDHAAGVDLVVGTTLPVLRTLRELGWRGRAVVKALGELPRGGAGLRALLPHLDGGDVVWCSSAADLRIYRALVGSGGPRAVVVPYGLADDRPAPAGPDARARLRRRWGLPPRDFVLVYAGRVTLEKNVHALLEVTAVLRRAGWPARLLIVGSWEEEAFDHFCLPSVDLRGRLVDLARSAGLERHVHLLPPLDDAALVELLRLADAFVNLTLHHDENFGYAQVEAMGAGLPVVATAWGGVMDTVRDGETGLLADTWLSGHGIRFDLPRVVDALEQLAGDPGLRDEMGRAAAHTALEYGPAAYRARLLALVAGALAGPHGGSPVRYTAFGAAFDRRFRRPGRAGNAPAAPVYHGFSDPDYTRLIEPYTSRGWLRHAPGSRLFVAIAGRVEGDRFVSSDPLWPGRIPLSEPEARALRRLDRRRPVPDRDVDHGLETIPGLLQKGLAGIAWDRAAVPSRGVPGGRIDRCVRS